MSTEIKEAVKVGDLRQATYNPRKITKEQLARLGRALKEFGDLGGIVYNRRTGNLVGGHQRVKHLDPAWPIKVDHDVEDAVGTVGIGHIKTPFGVFAFREVDWSLEKEMAANIACNKQGGSFDDDKLREVMQDLSEAQFDLELTGFGQDELPGLLDDIGKMERDHGGPDRIKEKLDTYLAGEVKQITLYFKGAEFNPVIAKMEKLMAKFGVKSNTEVFVKLLEFYEANSR